MTMVYNCNYAQFQTIFEVCYLALSRYQIYPSHHEKIKRITHAYDSMYITKDNILEQYHCPLIEKINYYTPQSY